MRRLLILVLLALPLTSCVWRAALPEGGTLVTITDDVRHVEVGHGDQLNVVLSNPNRARCDFMGGTLVGVVCTDVDF